VAEAAEKRATSLQAFSLLTSASQQTNMKLVDVAGWLVAEQESELGGDPTRHN
jgi:hypothetical protein